jgi:hypothetical protein
MNIPVINAATVPNLFSGNTLPLNATQANVEAAGLLLYLNNLVETYDHPLSKSLINIAATIITQFRALQKQYGPSFSSNIAAGVHTAFEAYDNSSRLWGCFTTIWQTGGTVCQPFNTAAVITDAQSQIQNDSGNLLPLPTSGGGADATFLFAMSMVENGRDSTNFFADGGASIYAAATAEFFQDAGILSEAADFPITASPGQDEQYFVEYLQNYETNGIPFTNAQINAQAATLLQQYINTLKE